MCAVKKLYAFTERPSHHDVKDTGAALDVNVPRYFYHLQRICSAQKHARKHTRTRTRTNTYTRTRTHTHTHVHACTNVRMHECTHARTHTCTHAYRQSRFLQSNILIKSNSTRKLVYVGCWYSVPPGNCDSAAA